MFVFFKKSYGISATLFSAAGVSITPEKIDALMQVGALAGKEQLHSFLGISITTASLFPNCQHWEVCLTGYCVRTTHGVGTVRAKWHSRKPKHRRPHPLCWPTTIQEVRCGYGTSSRGGSRKPSSCGVYFAHFDCSRKEVWIRKLWP